MIVFGIVKIIGYFSKDLFRLAFQYDFEFGIILIVLGTIVLARTSDALNHIFIAAGIAVLADSLFKMRISEDARKFGIHAWWTILMFAVLTGLVGILLAVLPWESARLLTMLLGVSLLSEGMLHFCIAVSTVKIVQNQYPDSIESDYFETEAIHK